MKMPPLPHVVNQARLLASAIGPVLIDEFLEHVDLVLRPTVDTEINSASGLMDGNFARISGIENLLFLFHAQTFRYHNVLFVSTEIRGGERNGLEAGVELVEFVLLTVCLEGKFGKYGVHARHYFTGAEEK